MAGLVFAKSSGFPVKPVSDFDTGRESREEGADFFIELLREN